MAVAQRKLHDIAHLQPTGAVLHVYDAVVGGATDDGQPGLSGDEGLQLTHICPAQRQNGAPPYAAIHIHGLASEGVNGKLADGVGGLFPHLYHLGPQGKAVHPQVVHILNAPVYLQVLAQQDILTDAQMVDARRHGTPVYQRVRAGGAAGDDLQLAADALFNARRNVQQSLHLLGRGLGGAVARQVHADACQLHMGQLPLHVDAHVHHLVFVPEALPQVAQIGHDDDPVGLALQNALLLQRVQRDALTLEGRFAQTHHVRQLGKAGDADQQPRAADTGGAAPLHLLQAAGT